MTLLGLGRASKLPLLSKITLLPFGRDVTLRNVRSGFALPSLWLHLGSELMMDTEGHHQGGRAEPKHLTRRDGVSNPLKEIEPFEKIRMNGITSISVGGMVLH